MNSLHLIFAQLLVLPTSVCAWTADSADMHALSPAEVQSILQEKGAELTDADLTRISTAANLKALDLTGCSQITDRGLKQLTSLTRLESLSLASCHRVTLKGIEAISTLPLLTCLDLSSTRLSLPDVYQTLTALPKLTRLEIRDIRGFRSDGRQQRPRLEHLDISNSTGGITDKDLAPLSALTSLRHLNLNGSRQWSANRNLTDKGLKHLELLVDLEFLGLFGHFTLTADGYNPLFRKLVKLRTLEMGFNWPLKGGRLRLPDSLENLDMMESFQLSDASVITLQEKKRLKTLNLKSCLEMTDSSL